MSIHGPTLRFTRGPHHYVLAGTEEGQGYIGTRDGAVIARGHDRYSVARALIVAGTPIKRRTDDA
jgi:hypothetical protein